MTATFDPDGRKARVMLHGPCDGGRAGHDHPGLGSPDGARDAPDRLEEQKLRAKA